MLRVTLTACGLVAATLGTWRGYANGRAALAPRARFGESTRAAIEPDGFLLVGLEGTAA